MNRPPAHHNCRDQGPVRNTLPRINHIRQNRRAAAPRLPAGMGAGDPDDDAAVPLQAFFIRHWRFYRESTRYGRRHRRQSAGIRQAAETDQLGGRDRRPDQAGSPSSGAMARRKNTDYLCEKLVTAGTFPENSIPRSGQTATSRGPTRATWPASRTAPSSARAQGRRRPD